MITDLDESSALDPERVGAKAAALARARQSGMPVLPGFVVETSASLRHMEIGSAALPGRGSGGARLAVTAEPVPGAARIEAAGSDLADTLAARSSTPLETSGVWAGAFTSYLGITPEELPKAVAGCWASAFSLDALNRLHQAGIEPGKVAMAVLVQPAVDPSVGGIAEILPDGTVVVEAVAGSPAPLLQGWERGVAATRHPGHEWVGAEAISLIGTETLDDIGSLLATAQSRFGYDRSEWGVAGRLWILQLGASTRPEPVATPVRAPTPPELVPLVQSLMAAPGVLGSQLVHPWALGGLPAPKPSQPVGDGDLLQRAVEIGESLTSEVWGLPVETAIQEARGLLARLRGPTPELGIATIRRLKAPDPDQASLLISVVHALGELLVARRILPDLEAVWHLSTAELRAALDGEPVTSPGRVGLGVWEPLAAAVVLDHGAGHQGTPAAAGIGVGLRHHVTSAEGAGPPHRAVVTAPSALPSLSQLVWDAAGLVTDGGGPAAHVFESARSLGVPAVCGVDLGSEAGPIVAVDGYAGLVATLSLTTGR